MSLRLMRPEIVGPIQILHDDGVRACEKNTGIWVFIIGLCHFASSIIPNGRGRN
jgi:hypothetical protein